MNKKANPRLKPCPFCGGSAYTYTCTSIKNGYRMEKWLVHCMSCELNYPPDCCDGELEVIETWNKRESLQCSTTERK